MTLAPSRIGIDISKAWLDIFDATAKTARRIANTSEAITELIASLPPQAIVVFEATAPYDLALRRVVSGRTLIVYRVNPSRARAFARAAGFLAKTDAVDARMLAAMADALSLRTQTAFDAEREALIALHRRRDQLVEARAVERGRSADVDDATENASIVRHIAWLDGEIAGIDDAIEKALMRPAFAASAEVMRSIKGVGAVTVTTLVALLPELGNRNAKEIAALAGLAPINCDSGTIRGQRHVTGGRRRVRRALYMAALAVIRYVPKFKMYYQTIKQRSGHAKVALIAVARKLLVILNAMLKSGTPFKPTHAP